MFNSLHTFLLGVTWLNKEDLTINFNFCTTYWDIYDLDADVNVKHIDSLPS